MFAKALNVQVMMCYHCIFSLFCLLVLWRLCDLFLHPVLQLVLQLVLQIVLQPVPQPGYHLLQLTQGVAG